MTGTIRVGEREEWEHVLKDMRRTMHGCWNSCPPCEARPSQRRSGTVLQGLRFAGNDPCARPLGREKRLPLENSGRETTTASPCGTSGAKIRPAASTRGNRCKFVTRDDCVLPCHQEIGCFCRRFVGLSFLVLKVTLGKLLHREALRLPAITHRPARWADGGIAEWSCRVWRSLPAV